MLQSYYHKGKIEAGCDEAGRGCLAGSVYAAAVIFPADYQNEALNDSKQLTDKRRHELREVIQRDALAWAVGIVTPEEIDKINILNASILAMHRALDQLKVRPEAIIVDGNRFKPYKDPLPAPPSRGRVITSPHPRSSTPPSSRATASTSPLPPPASWPRPTVTTIWTSWPRSTRSTTGSATRAIPPRSTVRPSNSTASPPITASPSTSLGIRS